MKPFRWFAFGLLFPLYGSAAAGTTIDFEEPEIDSPHESVDQPYVMNGVEFYALGPMALYREDAFPGCANPENQWLYGGFNSGWPLQPAVIAQFPESPADPVHVVTVEVGSRQQTFLGMTLVLQLYDASNQLVGSSTLQPVAECWLDSGTLTAASDVPVQSAVMSATEYYLDCIGGGIGDECGWRAVWIDNFTYETEPVSVDAISWGRIKAQYR